MKFAIEDIKAVLEQGTLQDRLSILRWLEGRLDEDVVRQLNLNARNVEICNGAQSRAFMVSLLPKIWEHMLTLPRGTLFSVLDVGPGSGFGSELFAAIHAGNFAGGYKVEMTVLDIRDAYFDLMEYRHRSIKNRIRGDLYKLDRTFDLVICSHVIEHVPNPEDFVLGLQKVAKQRVFLLTPWKENPDVLTKGHINIFDEEFTRKFQDSECELMENIAWGSFMKPRYKMLYMGLPGLAG